MATPFSWIVGLLVVWVVVVFDQHGCQEQFKCPSNQFYLYPCQCLSGGYKGLSIYCNNANLATISLAVANVKVDMSSVHIAHSNISRLFGPLFKEKTVLSLVVEQSNLVDVDHETFNCIKSSLKSLVFDGNKFTKIPESINKIAANLSHLAFINTPSIQEVSNQAFTKLTNLHELDLHNNSLRKFGPQALTSLTLLESLNLSYNRLTKFERNFFRQSKKLKTLDISHNEFKEIGKSDFNDLIGITTLNISHNQLKDLPRSIFSRMSQLRTLNLSGNRFKQIDSYMLRGVRFLRDFIASQNNIIELAKNAFISTTRIKNIDLSWNNMTSVETEVFKDLQYLDVVDLSYNQIEKLRKGTFTKMFKVSLFLNCFQCLSFPLRLLSI